MNMIGNIKNYLYGKIANDPTARPVVEAYDTWSSSYDDQPNNLMLHLDEIIFNSLLQHVELENKLVADIGCGTGRHWNKIYQRSPALLTGFDVSAGMLKQLHLKYPSAITRQVTDDILSGIPDESFDCIISTLTIAHIKDLEIALDSWCRVLKHGAHLVITDFHPATLARGGKRSFTHGNRSLSVINYVHPLNELILKLNSRGFDLIRLEERKVDASVRPFYEKQHAMAVFEKYEGMPIIFGLHLKKKNAAE